MPSRPVQKLSEAVLKQLAEEQCFSRGTRKDVCKGWNVTLHLATGDRDEGMAGPSEPRSLARSFALLTF